MLHLYDTRARSQVPIEPSQPGRLSLYACGPTVYRDAHVGNLRSFMLADLISRTAKARGLAVTVVQNITDVGHMLDDTGLGTDSVSGGLGHAGQDRMLAAAQQEGGTALAIARRYEAGFKRDCELLGITPASHYPRASECIDSMVAIITKLIDSGHAYVGDDGSVFFDARSFPSYGAISGNRLDALRPGHRFDGESDPNKRFHADWALWKAAPATRTQLVWDTSLGRGFPGWHIECTAMLLGFLGEQVDIHTGGIDLRFPHHEDERAQTESVVGHEVVRHWVHAEHLLFEGRKMSKSAGNVVLLSDVVARGFSPRALRLAFLEQHYRTQVDLSWDAIAAAHRLLTRWRGIVADAQRASAGVGDESAVVAVETARQANRTSGQTDGGSGADAVERVVTSVLEAFENDLNTALAIRILRDFERSDAPLQFKAAALRACDDLLGLDLDSPTAAGLPLEVPADAEHLLHLREQARTSRQWAEADAIRDQLLELGWVVTDTAQGQRLSSAQR